MSQQAAPQNKFGFCEGCPPNSEVGLAAYHLGFPIFLVVVIVSLVAGLKLSSKNRLLALLAMIAIGALILRLADSTIYFEKQFNVSYVTKESGRSFKSEHERIAYYTAEFSKVGNRYSRVFVQGWLAYSFLPFSLGLTYGIVKRRRRARLKAQDQSMN